MAADATCDRIWQELRKLGHDVPPPQDSADQASSYYKDYAAFAACNEVRSTIGRCSELPRDQFLDVFTRLVAGPLLEELFDLFKASRSSDHPALQYACLLALHGVAELGDRRKDLLTRPDVVGELCAVMASPRQRLVTPESAGAAGSEVINAAAGAVTTITGLFTSNRWVGVHSLPSVRRDYGSHTYNILVPISILCRTLSPANSPSSSSQAFMCTSTAPRSLFPALQASAARSSLDNLSLFPLGRTPPHRKQQHA